MSRKSENRITLKYKDTYYKFSIISQQKEGSLVCAFPNMNSTQKGVTQFHRFPIEDSKLQRPFLLKEDHHGHVYEKDPSVTYHTTGRVNYHNMNLEVQYLEPLHKISRPNPFFIVYFRTMKSFKCVSDNEKEFDLIVDITEALDKGLDIAFSIVPATYLEGVEASFSNTVVLGYPLFNLLIEFIDDSTFLRFKERDVDGDVIKIRPGIEFYSEQIESENAAFLEYEHLLYRTDEAIIKAPNRDGTVEVVFPTEMRKAPWISIEFDDTDLEIVPQSVERHNSCFEKARIRFKVRNKKTRQIIKDPAALKIKEIMLDAEIYEDEDVPPVGFI